MTRIDRRALFATGSAAALLALAGVSADSAPLRGGHLRAALSGGDRAEGWLDVPGGLFLQAARNAAFETLTEIAEDGTLQPGLAKGWRMSDGGARWEFDVQEGVSFHDGTLLTGADVIASLNAHGYEAEGDDTVRLELDVPDPTFPFRAAQDGLMIFKAEELASGEILSGTGPYRIKRFDPGRGFLGERVAHHRLDGRAAWFDSVELVGISDETVRAEAVRDGIVDVADLRAAHGLEQQEGLRLIEDDDGVAAALRDTIGHRMRTGPHPLDDRRFVTRWWHRA